MLRRSFQPADRRRRYNNLMQLMGTSVAQPGRLRVALSRHCMLRHLYRFHKAMCEKWQGRILIDPASIEDGSKCPKSRGYRLRII